MHGALERTRLHASVDHPGTGDRMKSKLLDEAAGRRTFALVLDTGDEVCQSILDFARVNEVTGAAITGIGAFRRVTLGFFDYERKDYRRIPVDEQVEVLSLAGDIAVDRDGGPKLHVHVVIGRHDGSAAGGHLLEGEVRPTLEVVVTDTPAALRRVPDADTGLALISL